MSVETSDRRALRATTARLGALALLFVATGCQSLEDGARDEFSHEFSCPKASVQARTSSDVEPFALHNPTASQPLPEVKADPARLALWSADQKRRRDDYNRAETVVEARGCGHHEIYLCGRANKGNHAGEPMCSPERYPPGMAPW